MKLFTKTQFKLGMDCPTKLYYSEKDEYVDISSTDPFLDALANGGYQVGELAKCEYHRVSRLRHTIFIKLINKPKTS